MPSYLLFCSSSSPAPWLLPDCANLCPRMLLVDFMACEGGERAQFWTASLCQTVSLANQFFFKYYNEGSTNA